jgi:methylamine utilization protein MauE
VETFYHLVADQHTMIFGRTFVAAVLLAAGVTKLGKRREFVGIVRNYRLLPESMVGFVGGMIPALETIVAVGLLFGVLTSWFAPTALGLFILFGSAVAINLLRGRRHISCGCFGPQQSQRLTWGLVIRNVVLGGFAGVIWVMPTGADGVNQFPSGETVATMLVAGATLASWWLWGVILRFWRLTEFGYRPPHDQ